MKDIRDKAMATTLRIWGRLRDVERDGFFHEQADALFGPMPDAMRNDMRGSPRVPPNSFQHLHEGSPISMQI